MMKIWTCTFTRSEKGPLNGLIISSKEKGNIDLRITDFSHLQGSSGAWKIIRETIREATPDMVLAPFDRPEMVRVAYEAYHMDIPVAQIFAGDIAGGAYDDADRFAISAYATLLFTADLPQYYRIAKFAIWSAEIGLPKWISCSGPTHYDGIPEPRGIEKEPMALVLYNPPSMADITDVTKECNSIVWKIDTLIKELEIDKVVWVGPNGDRYSHMVENIAENMVSSRPGSVYYSNVPRNMFLDMMERAKIMIGNSSSMFYEAPYYNTDIMQIGMRNRYREKISKERCKPGASRRILDAIENYLSGGIK